MEQETNIKIEQAMELAEKFEKGYEAGVYNTKSKLLRWAKDNRDSAGKLSYTEFLDKINSM